MNQKGFTYTEVIISFGMLVILFIPVISGLTVSGSSMRHAVEYYAGGLNANRLLLCVDNLMANKQELPNEDGAGLESFIEDFDTEYNTDVYSYRVVIQVLKDGALGEKASFTSGNPGDTGNVSFETGHSDLFRDGSYMLIVEVYDKKCSLIKRGVRLHG